MIKISFEAISNSKILHCTLRRKKNIYILILATFSTDEVFTTLNGQNYTSLSKQGQSVQRSELIAKKVKQINRPKP